MIRLRLAPTLLALLLLPLFAISGLAAPPTIHGLSLADLDTTAAPCRDFYRYADGGWIDRAKMPAAYSRYGGFEELSDRNLDQVHRLLEDAVRQAKGSTRGDLGLLATFYGTAMDSGHAELEGERPIEALLARIAALKSKAALGAEVARLHGEGIAALFFLTGMADPGNSSMVIATAGQGGLSLPDRDYYFRADSASQHVREEFVAHVARTFQLLGDPGKTAGTRAQTVMSIETALARASMTRVQQRDPKATYHKLPLGELRRLCPSFDWDSYLIGSGVLGTTELNVRQPDFFTALDSTLQAVPLADWKTYLRWQVARAVSPILSVPFVNEDFRFQRVLSGAKEMLPRWRRCLEATDRSLGDALGAVYVKAYFTPETKTRVLELVKNLKAAFRDHIRGLPWMSEATKVQALRKLDAMGVKIGWPDKWRDYSGLKLEHDSFAANWMRANRFERAWRLAKIGKAVDRSEFSMTPPTVNARYSPSLNDILFPAGILQPPFFDPQADDALNYGGIGAVIGHEMTHGFDDSGRQYDAEGNLKDWWTPGDAEKYQVQVDRIVAQYDAYTVLDTVHVNGRLTTGENVSDLGGLTMSHAALQKALAGKPRTTIDGFTPEQRFFLGYARIWRQLVRPAESVRRINTDPHSPGIWRVMGPLSNLPEFEQAFGCTGEGTMMRAEAERVKIW
jgi:putative endopeptidase